MKIRDTILVVLLAPFRFAFAMLKAAWVALTTRKEVVYKYTDARVSHRRQICDSCPHCVTLYSLPPARFCTRCGCNIDLQTRLATKKCPLGKW